MGRRAGEESEQQRQTRNGGGRKTALPRVARIFLFCFLIKNKPDRNLFLRSGFFESRQSVLTRLQFLRSDCVVCRLVK
jgi:hypothetical protein